MPDQDFVGSWWVTQASGDVNEACGHQIEIGGADGMMTIQCVDEVNHQYFSGTYQDADGVGRERIEMGAYWITFTDDAKSAITYGPAGGQPGEITGSWTASDHPWPPDGKS